MAIDPSFTSCVTRIREFIQRSDRLSRPSASTADREEQDHHFNALALDLFVLQRASNPAYGALCRARGFGTQIPSSWRDIPALPTSSFKDFEVSCLSPDQRVAMFQSSGTTGQERSRHFHSTESLSLYQASLLPWFQTHLLSGMDRLMEEDLLRPLDRPGMIFLTPPADAAPHSSLVHMFETVRREFAASDSVFVGALDAEGGWKLDQDRFLFAVRKSMCANRPVWILGTAFNWVHLLDSMETRNQRYSLAKGSCAMETGGYKGKSRQVVKSELHQMIQRRLGIPQEAIVCEYGMSELSSQAYDASVGSSSSTTSSPHPRTFAFPPWARSMVISPETGKEAPSGTVGLLRVIDLANAFSVLAVQTEDLARSVGNRFELLGRPTEAEQRGCSLMSVTGS